MLGDISPLHSFIAQLAAIPALVDTFDHRHS